MEGLNPMNSTLLCNNNMLDEDNVEKNDETINDTKG
jgi:hypothetical protein